MLTESAGVLRGAFVNDDSGTGQLIEGKVNGTHVSFTRRWTVDGARRNQEYSLSLDPSGQHLEGTFVETHAPGPPVDFSAERGFVDIERPFQGTAEPHASRANPTMDDAVHKASDGLPGQCNCKAYRCACSGVPSLMACHSQCNCPACPPNIP